MLNIYKTMLTPEQKKWINHLSATDRIKIVPYNPKVKPIFKKIKKEIQKVIGRVNVVHCGSTSLGIHGQGEIDCYIPVAENRFVKYLEKLINYFGGVGSIYPLKRARFVKYIDAVKIEIFLINEKSDDWINCIKFENFLKKRPGVLSEYKKLKEDSDGLSTQEYYRKKIEFINNVLLRD